MLCNVGRVRTMNQGEKGVKEYWIFHTSHSSQTQLSFASLRMLKIFVSACLCLHQDDSNERRTLKLLFCADTSPSRWVRPGVFRCCSLPVKIAFSFSAELSVWTLRFAGWSLLMLHIDAWYLWAGSCLFVRKRDTCSCRYLTCYVSRMSRLCRKVKCFLWR